VYRDRSSEEVRDIAVVRQQGDGQQDGNWSRPEIVHEDGWRIQGCPVNGPKIVIRDDAAALAWFTGGQTAATEAAADQPGPAVKVAFSSDGGARFGEPQIVDVGTPLGRVDAVFDDGGRAWVSWMREAGGAAEVRLRSADIAGSLGESLLVATTKASRASGFPRLAYLDGFLYLCWIDLAEGEPARIRLRRFELP
jgi:hypothetical protein